MQTKINLAKLTDYFIYWKDANQCLDKKWVVPSKARLSELLEPLPRSNGLDAGVVFDWNRSKPNKFIFSFNYYYRDKRGDRSGWTRHQLIITAGYFNKFYMRITGRNKNKMKESLLTLFNEIFEVDHDYQRKEKESQISQVSTHNA